MATATFDTHAYIKKLMSVGFTEPQAEVQVRMLNKLIESELATKRDIKELELSLKKDIESIKADTIKWLTGLFLAQCGIIAAMIKLF